MSDELIYTEKNKSEVFGFLEDFLHKLFRKSEDETKANLSTTEWIIYIGTLIFVLVMPFLYSRLTTENFLTPKEFFSRAFLGILGGLFCIRLFGSGLLRKEVALAKTSLDLPLVAFFGFCAISVVWNYNGISAIRDLRGVFVIMLLFPIIVNVYRSRWQVELLLWVVLFTGLATATIGFMETYNLYFQIDSSGIHYVKEQVLAKKYNPNGFFIPLFPQLASPDYSMGSVISTFGNRNYLGTFAMFVAFVPLAFIFYYRNIFMKLVSLGLFGWLLYGLYITRCRAALIGFAVGFIFMMIMAAIHFKGSREVMVMGGVIVISATLLCLLGGLIVSAITIRSESMWDKIKLTFTLNRLKSNTYERMWVWYGNNKAFNENKVTLLLGQGFGSFKHFFPLKEAEVFSDSNKDSFTAVTFRQAHNDWLQIFSELGIIGMILFLFLVKRFFASISNAMQKDIFGQLENRMNGDHILIIGLGAAIVAQLFAAVPDFPFHRIETAVFAVIFLSLVPVLTETDFFKSPLKRVPIKGLKEPLCIFLVFISLLGSGLNFFHEIRCWIADQKVRESELLITYKNKDFFAMIKARQLLLDAINLDPLPGDPYSKLATWYEYGSSQQFYMELTKSIDILSKEGEKYFPELVRNNMLKRNSFDGLNSFIAELRDLAKELKSGKFPELAIKYADKAWNNINFNARSTYHSITFRKMHIYYHIMNNIVMAYQEALKGLNRTAGDARNIYYFYAGKIATELLNSQAQIKGIKTSELETNAEKFLNKLEDVDNYKIQANAALAIFYSQRSKWAEALKHSKKVCNIYPNEPTIQNILGLSSYYMGDYETSIQALNKAISLNPSNPIYHRDIGTVYKSIGKYAEAKEHFEKCAAATNCPENLRAFALNELKIIKIMQEKYNGNY